MKSWNLLTPIPFHRRKSKPTGGTPRGRQVLELRRARNIHDATPTKHGFFASAAVTKDGEDAAPFEKLLRSLRKELNPVGELQELLIEQLAVSLLKERRAQVWERTISRKEDSIESEVRKVLATGGTKEGPRVPPGLTLDLLLRYQSFNHKQIRFVFEQLDRLRRAHDEEHLETLVNSPESHD